MRRSGEGLSEVFAQQPHTVDAVIGIDERLCRDCANTGGDMRHAGAHGEEPCRDRNSKLPGGAVSGDDRPGHLSPYRPAA
jgi:hypothetical protein